MAARPHIPPPEDAGLGDYKEWWHFNLIDDRSGVDAVVNLSVAGDLYRPGAGEGNLIVLVHLPGVGWAGGVDQFDGLAARLDSGPLDIALGRSSIGCEGSGFRLRLSGADGSLDADLGFEPHVEPLAVWKDTPLGGGRINWMLTPNMSVAGLLRVGERLFDLSAARGYHDHNWGAWQWGNFGWTWGFCSAGAERDEGEAHSFVYNASLERSEGRTLEHSLLIWRGERLAKLFLREDIRARRQGRFAGLVRRVPGAMNLIDHSRVTSVPRVIEMSARDGLDWIEARYEPETAIQIAVPRETGFGLVELNETLGSLVVRGRVGGCELSIARRACFEFVG